MIPGPITARKAPIRILLLVFAADLFAEFDFSDSNFALMREHHFLAMRRDSLIPRPARQPSHPPKYGQLACSSRR